MEYDFLVNDLYNYLGINEACEKDVISIDYEHGVQLNIVLNESGYLKLIMLKGFEFELSHNKLLLLANKNLPSTKGDSIIYGITENKELILWLRVRVEEMVLNDLLNTIKEMYMEINDIINLE